MRLALEAELTVKDPANYHDTGSEYKSTENIIIISGCVGVVPAAAPWDDQFELVWAANGSALTCNFIVLSGALVHPRYWLLSILLLFLFILSFLQLSTSLCLVHQTMCLALSLLSFLYNQSSSTLAPSHSRSPSPLFHIRNCTWQALFSLSSSKKSVPRTCPLRSMMNETKTSLSFSLQVIIVVMIIIIVFNHLSNDRR